MIERLESVVSLLVNGDRLNAIAELRLLIAEQKTKSLDTVEKEHLILVLGNHKEAQDAAKVLDIPLRTLYNRRKRHGLKVRTIGRLSGDTSLGRELQQT